LSALRFRKIDTSLKTEWSCRKRKRECERERIESNVKFGKHFCRRLTPTSCGISMVPRTQD